MMSCDVIRGKGGGRLVLHDVIRSTCGERRGSVSSYVKHSGRYCNVTLGNNWCRSYYLINISRCANLSALLLLIQTYTEIKESV